MPTDKNTTKYENQKLRPVTKEKGLQPAKNPPQMPPVKPPKSEKAR